MQGYAAETAELVAKASERLSGPHHNAMASSFKAELGASGIKQMSTAKFEKADMSQIVGSPLGISGLIKGSSELLKGKSARRLLATQ
jgi:hypothetical protein